MPDDGEVGGEDAAKGLEHGVCAERDVGPCEVGVAAVAQDDGEAHGRDYACSVWVSAVLGAGARSKRVRIEHLR